MTATGPLALRTMAVVGGGLVAWSAAISFARALPHVRLTIVPAPVPADALADRFASTFSGGAAMLEQLGIDAQALAAQHAVTPRLATQYVQWPSATPDGPSGRDFIVGDGPLAQPPGAPATYQLWLRAAGAQTRPPLDVLSPAVFAARGPTGVALLDHPCAAWRLDADRGVSVLARMASVCGVSAAPAAFARCTHAEGLLRSITLANGVEVTADLYIDATGPGALLSAPRASGWIDWSGAPVDDRLLIAADDIAAPSSPVDLCHGARHGWLTSCGQVRILAFSSTRVPCAAAQDVLAHSMGMAAAAVEECVLRPGRWSQGWHRNVLKLGDAAVQPGLLARTGYGHALDRIALALELLPGRDLEPGLIAEYNRRAGLRADRLRDYTALLQHGAMSAGQQVPPGLAQTLLHFARCGRWPAQEEDSFPRDTWAATLIGLGLHPCRIDPLLAGIAPEQAAAWLCQMASGLIARTPPNPSFSADRI